MLSIILDIAGGYLLARFVKNIWLALLAAIVVGISSSIATNMLIYATASDLFTQEEIGLKIAAGVIIHPIIAIVSLFIFRTRGRIKRRNQASPEGGEA
ncbi:hypothetical protein ABGV17_06685 [Guyparkeria sp. GHLCS8-2]|uniref:hypothetical protein n=1 Tax=Guyparkeria halopsychrophila TaxID=3139421 RepID=UPI0037CCA8D0